MVDDPRDQTQGSDLGSFSRASASGCAIQNGDPFLAIAVPPTMPLIATIPICSERIATIPVCDKNE